MHRPGGRGGAGSAGAAHLVDACGRVARAAEVVESLLPPCQPHSHVVESVLLDLIVRIHSRPNFTGDGYATVITEDLSDCSSFHNYT